MTSVLFMWSNLIRTVFLVLSVYGECLFRVYLTLWQTDARNNYPVFCCCELGIKNRTHNFLTWTGENIRNFSWQDTSARQHKLIFFLLLFPLYSSLSRFTQEKKPVTTKHDLQTQRKAHIFCFIICYTIL